MKIYHKLLFLLPLLLLFSVSTLSQQGKNSHLAFKTLAGADTIINETFLSQLFNKKEIIIRNADKDTIEISGFKNGKLHGEQKLFYKDGELKLISNYKKGFRNGKYKIYYANGKLKEKGKYFEKIKVGDSIYKNVFDGRVVRYYDNGSEKNQQKYGIENWKNYKRNGVFEEYSAQRIPNEPTELSHRCFFLDNLKTDVEEYFDINGEVTYRRNLEIVKIDGEKVSQQTGLESIWRYGKLISTAEWKNNKKNGVSKYYFENGQLERLINFKDGELTGRFQSYYENGQLKTDYLSHERKYSYLNHIGWKKQFDEQGEIKELFYLDENGGNSIKLHYENGKSKEIYILDLINIKISKNQKIETIHYLNNHQTDLGFDMFSNEKLKRINLNTINHGRIIAKVTNDDALLQIHNTSNQTIEDEKTDEMARKIAAQYNPDWNINELITEGFKDGAYQFNYADGSPFIIMEFKDSLPYGNWILYNPIGNDTLLKREFENNLPVGNWIRKSIDGANISRSNYFPNHREKDKFIYWENGNLKLFSIKDSSGNQLDYTQYYENGNLREKGNPSKNTYLFLESNGDTTKYSVLQTEGDSIRIDRVFYSENKLQNEQRINMSTGKIKKSTYHINGQLKSRMESTADKYLKDFKKYDTDGKLLESGQYFDEKKQGEWIDYSIKDQITVYQYENDKVMSRQVYEDKKGSDDGLPYKKN